MNTLNIRVKIFLITAVSAFFLLVLPSRCFALNLTESESRVYRERLVTEIKKYVGTPYVRGATGPDAFDCSGLVYTVTHDAIAYQLPRTVKAMYANVTIVPDSQKEPGDLVFFRTTGDGTISHVGMYIGKEQFISAVSDGPNTGVIVSSLKESYWKAHYASCGKFLPSANWKEDGSSEEFLASNEEKTQGFGTFTDRLTCIGTFTGDWSLFTEKRFMPNFRGLSSEAGIFYHGATFSPGFSAILRWNYGVKAFQIPLIASLYFGNYVRAYAGPVFTLGTPYAPDTDSEIKASIFPGIMGITFNTPSITKGTYKVQIIQDISYTVFNNTSNSALSPLKSASAGLEFSTGARVTFPFSVFFKK